MKKFLIFPKSNLKRKKRPLFSNNSPHFYFSNDSREPRKKFFIILLLLLKVLVPGNGQAAFGPVNQCPMGQIADGSE